MQERQKQMNYGLCSDVSLTYVYDKYVTNKSSINLFKLSYRLLRLTN